MITNEGGYTWASCDKCTFTMGVCFDADKNDVLSAFKQWGWQYKGGKIICKFCLDKEISNT